jgi:membrane protease YdiL (CAAX protease family)
MRHGLVAYFALTFAISWGGALLAIGGAGAMRGTTPGSDPRFAYAVIAMLTGPTVTGVALTALLYGRAGLCDLCSRLLTWRVGFRRSTVALLAAPVLMTGTLLALSSASPAFLPGILVSEDKRSLLRIGLAVGIAAGVFEELGWTGFAIPALRKRHGVLATGVIVGIWWSAWHLLPNVWAARPAAGELPMPVYLSATLGGVFVGYLTAFRILMVWVYDRTRSILVAMLMHVSLTTSLLILNPAGISGANLQVFSFAFAAVVWAAVVVIGTQSGWRLDRRPRRTARRAA